MDQLVTVVVTHRVESGKGLRIFRDCLRAFEFEQQFTTDDLCDRVASTSFVAALAPVDREELLVRVRALTHDIAEPFAYPYKTEVQVIPRSSDRDEKRRGTSIKG